MSDVWSWFWYKVSVLVADMYGLSILAFFMNTSEILEFSALLYGAFAKS